MALMYSKSEISALSIRIGHKERDSLNSIWKRKFPIERWVKQLTKDSHNNLAPVLQPTVIFSKVRNPIQCLKHRKHLISSHLNIYIEIVLLHFSRRNRLSANACFRQLNGRLCSAQNKWFQTYVLLFREIES